MKITGRIGEINYNRYGNKMKIVEYINCTNIIVEFENGYKRKTRYDHFKNGTIKIPYDKSIFGKGFIGEGQYNITKNGKRTNEYNKWLHMFERIYATEYKEKCYEGCSICKEWHNFQIFAKWCNENYYEIDGEQIQLDKDILIKGNKIYSPETCIFVPEKINYLFRKRGKTKKGLPVGVGRVIKNSFKYISHCKNKNGKRIYLGSFETTKEAFESYKIYKEKIIKQFADEYKNKIPNKLYESMLNYKIEITDYE